MKAALDFIVKDIVSSPNTSGRAKFFIKKMMQEGMSELRDAPPEIIEDSFLRSTALMYWISTGTLIENLPMPEGFWEYSAGMVEGPKAAPALESGNSVDENV